MSRHRELIARPNGQAASTVVGRQCCGLALRHWIRAELGNSLLAMRLRVRCRYPRSSEVASDQLLWGLRRESTPSTTTAASSARMPATLPPWPARHWATEARFGPAGQSGATESSTARPGRPVTQPHATRDVDYTHTDDRMICSGSGPPSRDHDAPAQRLAINTTSSISAPMPPGQRRRCGTGLGHDVRLAPPGSSTDQPSRSERSS